MQEFLTVAKGRHSFNEEQAMALLYREGYNLERAYHALPTYIVHHETWAEEQRVLFAEAHYFYDNNFHLYHRIVSRSLPVFENYLCSSISCPVLVAPEQIAPQYRAVLLQVEERSDCAENEVKNLKKEKESRFGTRQRLRFAGKCCMQSLQLVVSFAHEVDHAALDDFFITLHTFLLSYRSV